jgi:hypothetical protein
MLENVSDELIIIYDPKRSGKCRILYLFNKNALEGKIFDLLLGNSFLFQTVYNYFFVLLLWTKYSEKRVGEVEGVAEDVEWGCGCESAVYPTPTLIPTPSIYKDSLKFFHSYQTNKANYEIHLNFCSDGEKNEKKIIIFQRNVLSTKCFSTKVSLDERHRIQSVDVLNWRNFIF